jgi:hypothetical protein
MFNDLKTAGGENNSIQNAPEILLTLGGNSHLPSNKMLNYLRVKSAYVGG